MPSTSSVGGEGLLLLFHYDLSMMMMIIRSVTTSQQPEAGAVDQEALGCFAGIPYQPQCGGATPFPSQSKHGGTLPTSVSNIP